MSNYRERKAEKYRAHCNSLSFGHLQRAMRVATQLGDFTCLNEVKRLLLNRDISSINSILVKYEAEAFDFLLSVNEIVDVPTEESPTISDESDVEVEDNVNTESVEVEQCVNELDIQECSSEVKNNELQSQAPQCSIDPVINDDVVLEITIKEVPNICKRCDPAECQTCISWDEEPPKLDALPCEVTAVIYAGPASGKTRLIKLAKYRDNIYDTDHDLTGLNNNSIVFTNQRPLLRYGRVKISLKPSKKVERSRWYKKRRVQWTPSRLENPPGTIILSTDKHLDEVVRWKMIDR